MDFTNIAISVFSIVFLVVLFYVIPKLRQLTPDVPYEQYLESSKQMINVIEGLIKSLGLTPDQASIVSKIEKYAKLAVDYSEQLYKSGQLPAEQRKEKAIEFVKLAMKEAGTDLTDSQMIFVSSVIESIVFLLPAIDKTDKVFSEETK